jgi:hypothetical protein
VLSNTRRIAAAALVSYLALALAVTQRLWHHPVSDTIGSGGGDAALFLSFLSNTATALWHGGGHGLLVTHALNAPDGINVMWNTGLLLPAVLLSPLTYFIDPVLTLNVLLLVGPALSAWSAYLCLGRFVDGVLARFVGGLVFGFSPALMSAELGHLHLTLLFLVPPLLLTVVDVLESRGSTLRLGSRLGLLIAAQLLTGEEVLALTAVTGLVVAVLLAVQLPQQARTRLLPTLGAGLIAGGVTLALAGYPLLIQFFGSQRVQGQVQPEDVYVLDPVNLMVPNSAPLLHVPLIGGVPHLALNAAENMGYLGLPLIALLTAVSWAYRRDLVVRTAATTGAVLVVLSFGFTLHLAGGHQGLPLPWDLTRGLPVLGSLLPVRWMLLVDLFVALLVAVWLDRRPANQLFRSGAVFLALLPLLPHGLEGIGPTGTPAFFRAGADELTGVDLLLPYPNHTHTSAMIWQAEAGMRFSMPGGYFIGPQGDHQAGFGDYPVTDLERTFDSLGAGRPVDLTPRLRDALRQDLSMWKVRTIVLGPCSTQHALLDFLVALLHGQPTTTAGVLIWRDVGQRR